MADPNTVTPQPASRWTLSSSSGCGVAPFCPLPCRDQEAGRSAVAAFDAWV
jgi:hypothetical protein